MNMNVSKCLSKVCNGEGNIDKKSKTHRSLKNCPKFYIEKIPETYVSDQNEKIKALQLELLDYQVKLRSIENYQNHKEFLSVNKR